MFCAASRPFASLHGATRVSTRCFHRITTDFITHNATGKLVTRKVPAIIGNPGQSYVLIHPAVGVALRAGATGDSSQVATASASAARVGDTCALSFFHNSRYFGSESSSYPRLYIPNQIPRQTESDINPATLFLSGKMHEINLDGTAEVTFAEHASATGKNLGSVLDQLKDM